jgi:hypothetical protein
MLRLALAVLLLPLASLPSFALDIPGDPSSCGVVVERGDPGVLQGDLDCTGHNITAVTLRPGATLDLNGHRITGGSDPAIECYVAATRTCTVDGPGELAGSSVGVFAASRARIRDVIIHDNAVGIHMIYGDVAHAARLELDRVTIRDNTNEGVKGGGLIAAKDSAIRDNGGIGTTSFGPSKFVRTTITGNGGSGIVTGVYSDFYAQYFYNKRQLFLSGCDVSGNGGVDILSGRRPRLVGTTCGTSGNPLEPGNPAWGVCSGD